MPIVVLERTHGTGWCCSTLASLKWLEIICCCVIIGLLSDFLYGRNFYGFIMFTAAFCLAVTFLLLVIYFFLIHDGAFSGLPWVSIEVGFNFLAFILFGVTFGLAVWDTVEMFHGRRDGSEEWRNRMAAISAFSGAATVLYFLSCLHGRLGISGKI